MMSARKCPLLAGALYNVSMDTKPRLRPAFPPASGASTPAQWRGVSYEQATLVAVLLRPRRHEQKLGFGINRRRGLPALSNGRKYQASTDASPPRATINMVTTAFLGSGCLAYWPPLSVLWVAAIFQRRTTCVF
jgi:hypothetical protein